MFVTNKSGGFDMKKYFFSATAFFLTAPIMVVAGTTRGGKPPVDVPEIDVLAGAAAVAGLAAVVALVRERRRHKD